MRDEVVALFKKKRFAQAANSTIDFSKQPDLRSPGKFHWQKKTLTTHKGKTLTVTQLVKFCKELAGSA